MLAYPAMERPRWHDWVIALAIAAIAVTGVVALWGQTLRGWIEGEPASSPGGPEPLPGARQTPL